MKYKPLLIYLFISSFFLTLVSSIWKIMATLQGLRLTEINFNINVKVLKCDATLVEQFLGTIPTSRQKSFYLNISHYSKTQESKPWVDKTFIEHIEARNKLKIRKKESR